MNLEEAFQHVLGGKMLEHHRCGICDSPVGFISNGQQLGYDSSCGCASSEPRLILFQEFIDFIRKVQNDQQH